jgi:hypothetical protein
LKPKKYRVSQTKIQPQQFGLALIDIQIETPVSQRQLDYIARTIGEALDREAPFVSAKVTSQFIPTEQGA